MTESIVKELTKFMVDKFRINPHKIKHYLRWIQLYKRNCEGHSP